MIPPEARKDLAQLGAALRRELNRNDVYKDNKGQIGNFLLLGAKPILDHCDRVLARQYGFTEEDLDFISNYDIKYRMGRDAEDDDE